MHIIPQHTPCKTSSYLEQAVAAMAGVRAWEEKILKWWVKNIQYNSQYMVDMLWALSINIIILLLINQHWNNTVNQGEITSVWNKMFYEFEHSAMQVKESSDNECQSTKNFLFDFSEFSYTPHFSVDSCLLIICSLLTKTFQIQQLHSVIFLKYLFKYCT